MAERQLPLPVDNIDAVPNSTPKLNEGKTKIIWEIDNPNLANFVRIESKDDITAGDGLRRDILPGKGKLANKTTVNVFNLLNSRGIPTHYITDDSEDSFIAHRCKMVPIECVARGIAFGSYLARNPEAIEGQKFFNAPVEFYLKDDSRHDPIIKLNKNTQKIELFNPKDPIDTRDPIDEIDLEEIGVTTDELDIMENRTRQVFEIMESAWKGQNVSLVDMKIEFGKNSEGDLLVADVIDNDSWRIWPEGDKSKMLDKQRYRNGEDLTLILANYRQVAEMTQLFLTGK